MSEKFELPKLREVIKSVTRYQTTDGDTHYSIESAEIRQRDIYQADFANEKLQKGETIGSILRALEVPLIDPILDEITKESSFVISHWQCRKNPGYKPCAFKPGLAIYVGGDAGSWSGSYGEWMSLSDLVGYAKTEGSILKPETAKIGGAL